MEEKPPVGRLIYCHSSAPDTILGETYFRGGEHTITIGRDSDNTIHLDKPYISGHHAQIIAERDRFLLKNVTYDNGIRRYAHRLRADSHVELQRFDYFSLPGNDLGDPEERYIFLFLRVNATQIGFRYQVVMPDTVHSQAPQVFGKVTGMKAYLQNAFDYIHSQRGHFVDYDELAKALWGSSEGDHKGTLDRYMSDIRSILNKHAPKLENPPVIIYHQQLQQQRARARLCLDDVLPALEQHALQDVPDPAAIEKIQTGNKDSLVLRIEH